MNKAYIRLNTCCTPDLNHLPTLLQKPVAKLQQLTSVAGISAGEQQADSSTILTISFAPDGQMNYRNALDCFNVAELRPKTLHVNLHDRYMSIKLAIAKSLMN